MRRPLKMPENNRTKSEQEFLDASIAYYKKRKEDAFQYVGSSDIEDIPKSELEVQ
jgi:hypothetical protein